jgi:transcriptional regulator with XRE-family HTH domain
MDAGLTISELAKRAAVSRDTISNAERGLHGLQATTLSKIARALGRAPSELLAEEERLAPKVESSSLEPSLLNGLEDERPPSIFAEAIALAAERWGLAVTSTDMAVLKRCGLIDAALDLSDVINERADAEDWEALPNQERHEIVTAMEKLGEVAERGLRRLEESTETQEQEQRVEERREAIKEWTRRIA